MNPLLRAMMQGANADGGGPTDPTSGEEVPLVYGMNLGSVFYFNAMPIFVDLLKQGPGIYKNDDSGPAAIDASGWPDEDFTFGLQRLPPDSPFSQTVTVLVDGNPGSVSLRTVNYWTLGAVVYDAGTDTATITLTSPDRFDALFEGCQLRFTNTKKTPGSSTGSGVRRVRIPRPGYESTPDQLVTNEFISIMSAFDAFRFVKVTLAEIDLSVVSWANYPRRTSVYGRSFGGESSGIMPIEDVIDIANACHINPWINIQGAADPSLGTASVDYGLAQYVEAHLDSDLVCVYEHCNETWNFGYRWFGYGNDRAMEELHGFWNDSFDRATVLLTSAQRTSNVITMGLNYAHGMVGDHSYLCAFQGRNGTGSVTAHPTDSTHFTIPDTGTNCKIAVTLGTHYYDSFGDSNVGGTRASGVVTAYCRFAHGFTTGDTVYVPLNGLTSVTKIFTITVIDSLTFTFSDAGSDGNLSLTSSNNSWGGSTSTGSELTYDGDPSASQYMSEKYWTRRRVQMSDLIRSAVPSNKFMTRHRPVYMSQMAQGTIYRFYDAKAMIEDGLGTTFGDKFFALGGGAYPDGTDSNGDRISQDYTVPYTKQNFLDAYQDSTTVGFAQSFFTPDIFSSFALSEGIESYNYEIGIDTKMYGSGTYRSANAIALRQATLDPAWKQIEKNFPEQLGQCGSTWANMFNGEMIPQSDNSGQGYWGISWGTLTASPKQTAHHEWHDNRPTMTRNVVPGTVDARYPIGFYEGQNGGTAFSYDSHLWPTMNNPWTAYPMPTGRWRYVIQATETRDMTLTIGFKTLAAVNHTITIVRNGVTLGTVTITSAGVGNSGTSSSITVPMTRGPNGIDLVRDTGNTDFEIHSLAFA